MAVKEKPAKFVASDGSEFTHKAEAERHDAVAVAVSNFNNSRRILGVAVSATLQTADGQPFDVTSWREYWRVVKTWGGEPTLRSIRFGYGTEIKIGDSKDQLRIVVQDEHRTNGQFELTVSDLYATEAGARKAWREAMKEYIAELQNKLNDN